MEVDGRWTFVMSAGRGIGCRGLVVEVDSYAIAWRKLGYSMGPILDAKGDPVSTMTVFHPFFNTLKLRWKFFSLRWDALLGGDGQKLHMMMTNIESSTESRKSCRCG